LLFNSIGLKEYWLEFYRNLNFSRALTIISLDLYKTD